MRELNDTILKLIKEDSSIINWNEICKGYKIPINIIKSNIDKISLRLLFTYQDLPETFIEQYLFRKDLVTIICQNQQLSNRFMNKYINLLDWNELIFSHRNIPEPLLRKIIDKVDIDDLLLTQQLSNAFIAEYNSKIDWDYIRSRAL